MMNTIEIQIDDELAEFYTSAPATYRQKIETLVGIWLRELRDGYDDELDQLMRRIGEEAQARGLTPEILADILADDDDNE